MWMRRLLGVLLIGAAASGVWAQESTPEPSPRGIGDVLSDILGSVTPEATPEATPWPTLVPDHSALPLTQTFEEDHGSFSLNYPANWLARGGYGQVYVANSQSALAHGFEDVFDPQEVQIGVFTGTLETLMPDSDLSADADVTEVANVIADLVQEQSEAPVTFGAVETLSVNDQPAAAMTFKRAGTDGYALIIDTAGDVYVVLQMLTAPHELDSWLSTANAVGASITLEQPNSPPPLTESFTLADESFTVKYPQGWTARESSSNGVDIATSPEVLEFNTSDEFAPGDVRIFVGSGSPDELFGELDVSDLSPVEILQAGIDMDDDDDVTYSEPEAFVINDRQAASTFVSQPNLEGYVVVIRYTDGMFVVAYVQTAVGEGDQWQQTLLDMLHML